MIELLKSYSTNEVLIFTEDPAEIKGLTEQFQRCIRYYLRGRAVGGHWRVNKKRALSVLAMLGYDFCQIEDVAR